MKRSLEVWVVLLVIVFLAFPAWASGTGGLVEKGNRAYRDAEYQKAAEYYSKALEAVPESPELNYNLGTALYKSGRFEKAVPHLRKGLLSKDPETRTKARFNLGNALFGQGSALARRDPGSAVESLRESLEHFDSVLNEDDNDSDARYNRDIVERELKRLMQQQPQQKQEQKKDQKQRQDQGEDSPSRQDQGEGVPKQKDNADSPSAPRFGQDREDSSPSRGEESSEGDENLAETGDGERGAEASAERGHTESSGRVRGEAGELSEKEARDLIRHFERNEAPSGLLNFQGRPGGERPVLKDW